MKAWATLVNYYQEKMDDIYYVKHPVMKKFQDQAEEIKYRIHVMKSVKDADLIIFVRKPDGTYGDHTLHELAFCLYRNRKFSPHAKKEILQLTHEEIINLINGDENPVDEKMKSPNALVCLLTELRLNELMYDKLILRIFGNDEKIYQGSLKNFESEPEYESYLSCQVIHYEYEDAMNQILRIQIDDSRKNSGV